MINLPRASEPLLRVNFTGGVHDGAKLAKEQDGTETQGPIILFGDVLPNDTNLLLGPTTF
jgi:hypothetical protein